MAGRAILFLQMNHVSFLGREGSKGGKATRLYPLSQDAIFASSWEFLGTISREGRCLCNVAMLGLRIPFSPFVVELVNSFNAAGRALYLEDSITLLGSELNGIKLKEVANQLKEHKDEHVLSKAKLLRFQYYVCVREAQGGGKSA
ncbi:hypothetical protein ACFE04_021677 [Oxalis oulophora]